MTAAECDAARMKIWIACGDSHKFKTYRNGACICDRCHAKVDSLEAAYKAGRTPDPELSLVLHKIADTLESIAWWFKVQAERFGDQNEVLR